MQYWIFYHHGVGGDGFSNLLEHANDMHAADGCASHNGQIYWREHGVYEGRRKFYACRFTLDDNQPFRAAGQTKFQDYTINEHYRKLIEQGSNTVIPVQYLYWAEIDKHPEKKLFTTDQKKIHLYTSDIARAYQDCIVKNQLVGKEIPDIVSYKYAIMNQLASDKYDIHIDIERVWKGDWDYLRSCLDSIGIVLDHSWYLQYLELVR
jgi:hypothetical protein